MSMFTGSMIDFWRVDPGQNRKSGECITRKMTPEEIKKYGPPVPRKKHDISNVKYMVNKKAGNNRKMTKEQLLAECRQLGTDRKACEKIAQKYGYSHYTAVQQRIRIWGIKEILKKEAEEC